MPDVYKHLTAFLVLRSTGRVAPRDGRVANEACTAELSCVGHQERPALRAATARAGMLAAQERRHRPPRRQRIEERSYLPGGSSPRAPRGSFARINADSRPREGAAGSSDTGR